MPINSSYSEALSAAVANYSKEIADNLTKNNALLAYISKKGNVKTYDGGTEILQTIIGQTAQPGGWYTGGETLDVSSAEVISTANFAFKQAYTNVTFTGTDQMIHTGKAKMHDFFKAKIEGAEADLHNRIGAALFNSNTEDSGKAIGGLQHLVADAGTGTVGGINSTDNTWWQNKVYDFSGASATPSANTIMAAVNSAYLQTARGNDTADLIVAGSTYFSYYEEAIQDKQRFIDVDNANGGFNGYRYKNAFVTYDENCSATRMYVLNTKFLHFRPHKDRNFVTADRKDSVNQDAYVVPIYWGGNLTVSGRARQAVICP